MQFLITTDEARSQFDQICSVFPDGASELPVDRLLQIVYECDAKAYTGEATYRRGDGDHEVVNAEPSLDRLFEIGTDGRLGSLVERNQKIVDSIFV